MSHGSVQDGRGKPALDLGVSGRGTFGSWPIVASPGIPHDRLKVLRDVFLKASSRPAFLADANKKQLEVEPIHGEELEALAKEVINQPPEVIERLKELLGK